MGDWFSVREVRSVSLPVDVGPAAASRCSAAGWGRAAFWEWKRREGLALVGH